MTTVVPMYTVLYKVTAPPLPMLILILSLFPLYGSLSITTGLGETSKHYHRYSTQSAQNINKALLTSIKRIIDKESIP